MNFSEFLYKLLAKLFDIIDSGKVFSELSLWSQGFLTSHLQNDCNSVICNVFITKTLTMSVQLNWLIESLNMLSPLFIISRNDIDLFLIRFFSLKSTQSFTV